MTSKPFPLPIRTKFPEPSAKFMMHACFAALHAGPTGREAHELSRDLFPDDEVSPLLLRSGVSPGSTTGSGWAAELAQTATLTFLQSLAPQSAAASLMALGLAVPMRNLATATVPGRPAGPVPAPWVGEDQPIPVRSGAFSGLALSFKKMGVISVFSRELMKAAGGQAIMEFTLREDAAASLDAAYFSSAAADANGLAGLLHGATAVASQESYRTALTELAIAVGTGGSGQVVFVASPGRAAAINVALPDLKQPVLPSTAIADNMIVAVDPVSIASAVGMDPEIIASTEAVVIMSDAPTPDTLAAPARSFFQTDALALRLILDLAFGKRRSGAVAYSTIDANAVLL